VRFLAEEQYFSKLHSVETGSEAHPAYHAIGKGALSPGVKRLGCEADHSLPHSAEVQNGGVITPFLINLHEAVVKLFSTWKTSYPSLKLIVFILRTENPELFSLQIICGDFSVCVNRCDTFILAPKQKFNV
jgi:hypothetical protein